MDVKTNAQRFLVVFLTIILLFSLGSFFRITTYKDIRVFVTDPSALISFNKYLYINLRPEGEILEEKGKFSQPFADKKQILNTITGFDYFIFSRTYTQKITNGADFRTLDIYQTGNNTITAVYTLNLRKEPIVGSFYHIQVDLPKIKQIFNLSDSLTIQDECELIVFKESNQNYKYNPDGLLLDVSKNAQKTMTIELNFALNCNQ